ncbi:Cysteine--tRNA ligase, mitochondrial, partial [Pseudolycoriella hygida]
VSNCVKLTLRRLYSSSLNAGVNRWNVPAGYDTNIRIYNPITKTKVPLILKRKNIATWYTCGPTVYDSTHIGHGTMNITDIDDKIIARSIEVKEDWTQLARRYEQEFWTDMKRLGIETPNVQVRVTDHMPQIIQFTQTLLDKQIAYRHTDGSVYFHSSKCPTLGKFQCLADEEHEFKNTKADFAVWKAAKPNEPYWTAPWGKGRPGWHIECSVLASLIFGNSLDFHGGGLDLRFPHHENEEAQCCSYHNIDQWVNYWIHTGQLYVAGESDKMSKSLKNTINITELLSNYTADEFRMLCLLSHYSNRMDFSASQMEKARTTCKKIKSFRDDIDAALKGQKICTNFDSNELHRQINATSKFIDAFLRDDFKTSLCIEHLLVLIKDTNKLLGQSDVTIHQSLSTSNIGDLLTVKNFIDCKLEVFGLNFNESSKIGEANAVNITKIVDSVVEIRNQLRGSAVETKDMRLFEQCDKIRDILKSSGIELKDRGNVSSWYYK